MGSIYIEENGEQKKYKGIRRRKWGKWVSEIRVPGSQNRLWLGTYASPEAAAVAHDVAFYCLRRPQSLDGLNFPSLLPESVHAEMSPKSVQRAASDAGMAIDAHMITLNRHNDEIENESNGAVQVLHEEHFWEEDNDSLQLEDCGKWEDRDLSISVEDYLK